MSMGINNNNLKYNYFGQDLSYNNPKHGLYFFHDLPYTRPQKSDVFKGYQSFTDNLNNGKYYYARHSGSLILDDGLVSKLFVSNLMNNKKAPFYVGCHGNQFYVYDMDRPLHYKELADMILKSDYKKGTPIMLGGCNIGKGNYPQRLADELKVPVQAPSDYFVIDSNGGSRISISDNLESCASDGYIKTFLPGNTKDKITVNFGGKQLNPSNRNFTEKLDYGVVDVNVSNIKWKTDMKDSWNRYISKKDLKGNLGNIDVFTADVILKDKEMNMFINYIKGDGVKLRNLKESIVDYAKSHGAESLNIEMMVINTKLKNHLIKHHDMKLGESDWTTGISNLADPKYFDVIDLKL